MRQRKAEKTHTELVPERQKRKSAGVSKEGLSRFENKGMAEVYVKGRESCI